MPVSYTHLDVYKRQAHTSGRVWIKGEEVNIRQPSDAIRKSVALLTEDRRATGIMGVLSVVFVKG